MDNLGLSLTVLVRVGNGYVDAREFRSPDDGNTYIEGREGSEFILRIRNGTHRRVLAIPSVDGLSTLDGKRDDSKWGGFVLEAYAHVDVKGWLRDREKAAAFQFAGMKNGVDDSYVARMGGDTNHKGVIGVLFLAEKPALREAIKGHDSVMLMASSASASKGVLRASSAAEATSLSMEEQTLGTGYGRETDFRTRSASFRRGHEIATINLFYDDARGLKRRGIDVTKPLRKMPQAFPAGIGCPPPPGWNG